MIIFVCYGHHSYTHKKILGKIPDCEIGVCSYGWLFKQTTIPKGTYVFMDRERLVPWELEMAGAFYRHIEQSGTAYRALNDPSKMSGRQSLLRKLCLHGINKFNAYAVSECRLPEKYPVFIRKDHDHSYPVSGLIPTKDDLLHTLSSLREKGIPDAGLLIVEYCAEALDCGLFRKLSSYKVGDAVFFYNTVHEDQWLVKYGTKNAASDELYLEEQKFINENAFEGKIRRAFDIAEIEYGRADFGIVNGECQIYEINTNPSISPPGDHPNPIRVQNMILGWNYYKSSVKELDTTNSLGPEAKPFSYKYLITEEKAWANYGIPIAR